MKLSTQKYFDEANDLWRDRLNRIAEEMQNKKLWVGLTLGQSMALYAMVRAHKPKIVMECGCGHGWSSQWILHALKNNGVGYLYSFDILHDHIIYARELSKDFRDICEFIEGDATPSLSCAFGMIGGIEKYSTMPDSWKDTMGKTLRKVGYADFLFMDGHHNYEFGKWWTTSVIQYLSKGGVIAIHDIGNLEDPSTCGGDEYLAVRELLSKKPNLKIVSLPFPFENKSYGMLFLRDES